MVYYEQESELCAWYCRSSCWNRNLSVPSDCQRVLNSSHTGPDGEIGGQYHHQRLTSEGYFRLLLLSKQRYSNDEFVRCSLREYDLKECPEYIAISYTWGSAEYLPRQIAVSDSRLATRPVLIDGRHFLVGENLHDLLAEFRTWKDVEETFLWIDALCINQKDPVEKSSEVAQVADIYSNASHGVVRR
jgi:hypothetical protein